MRAKYSSSQCRDSPVTRHHLPWCSVFGMLTRACIRGPSTYLLLHKQSLNIVSGSQGPGEGAVAGSILGEGSSFLREDTSGTEITSNGGGKRGAPAASGFRCMRRRREEKHLARDSGRGHPGYVAEPRERAGEGR